MNDYKDVLPSNFDFPEGLYRIISQNLFNFEPWYILNQNQLEEKMDGLSKRYPQHNLIPFAWRIDNDDVACFKIDKGEMVFIIHDFTSIGWEERETFKTFWDWFRSAINDMIYY